MLPMALVAQCKWLRGCRVLPGRGEQLLGDRVKAAGHPVLTGAERRLQILNGMN